MQSDKDSSGPSAPPKNEFGMRCQKKLQIELMRKILKDAGGSIDGPVLVAKLEVTPPYLSHNGAMNLVSAGIKSGMFIIQTDDDGKEMLVDADNIRA